MSDCHSPAPRRLSRRHALLALAAGVGAIALGEFGDSGVTAAGSASGTLNGPGSALAPAKRIGPARQPAKAPPAGKLIFPVEAAKDCYILDNFGACRSSGTRAHAGIDIMGSRGNPVYAVADGTLTQRYTNTGEAGWGWTLYNAATSTSYRYFHMAEDANGLVLKSQVLTGDIIGFVGNSGTSGVDNYHLHFEVRSNNVPVDPLPLLDYDTSRIHTGPPDKDCAGLPTL